MSAKKSGDRETGTGTKPAGTKKEETASSKPAPDPKTPAKTKADAPAKGGTAARTPSAKGGAPAKTAATGAAATGTATASGATAADGAKAGARSEPPSAPKPAPTPTSAPTTPEAARAPEPSRGGAGRVAIAVAVVGSLAAATISSWGPATIGYPAPAGGGERLAALETRLDALSARLASLDEESLPPLEERLGRLEDLPAADPEAIGALEARLDDLAGRIGALEAEEPGAPADLSSRLNALTDQMEALAARLSGVEGSFANVEGRVTAMQSTVEQVEGALNETSSALSAIDTGLQNNASLVLAVDSVRAALSNGQPFAELMPSLQGLDDGTPELTAALALLQEKSAGGLPTRRALIDRFEETAAAVRAAGNGGAEDESVVGRTLSRLTSLVDIQPAATPDAAESGGGGTAAILATARAHLDSGDLAATADALDGLEGAAAEAAAPWLGDVRARAAASGALETLRQAALVRLGQGAS